MTAECRPPANTPDGSVLNMKRYGSAGMLAISWRWKWADGAWTPYPRDARDIPKSPAEMAFNGWRIAEPPADG
jgi:hypothetical protein